MARAVWRIKFSNEENYKTMQNRSCCSDGGATVWHQLAGVESQSVAKSMASAACPWQNLPKCRVHVTTTVENVLVSVTGPTRYPNWHPMASVMSLRVCVCGHLCGMSSLSGASRSHSRGNARKTWHRRCTVWWRGLPGIEGQRISFPHSGTNSRAWFADAALCRIRLVWNSIVLKLFRVLQEIIVEEIVSDGIEICFPEPSRHKDALRKSRS